MGMVTSLLAMAVWGADPVSPPPVESRDEITCEVQMMTVEGLGWRSAAYAQLKPAARQGTATIWTADRSLKATLEAAAEGKSCSIKAPKVTTALGAIATVNSDKIQNYIRHVQRVSDGPINGGTKLAFVPEVAAMREGFSAVFSGRTLDQGVLAKVRLAQSHIGALHTFPLFERVTPPSVASPASMTPTEVGRQIIQTVLAPKQTTLQTTVQVPEVYQSEIEGEWFVPNDGVLLISMGVNTVADADGKAVVQERLAIFDFNCPTEDGCVQQAATMTPACRVDANSAVAPENTAKLTMPRVPDRSLPEAVNSEGVVFELPPLPESYASADLDRIKPGSPLATAQSTPITRPNRTISDPQLARTSLEAIPDHEIENFSYHTEGSIQPTSLASVVESFLRKGMGNQPVANSGLFPSLPNGNMVDVGPDRQEPFPNRTFQDIVTITDETPCDTPECPAEGCPFSATGCDDFKPTPLIPATAPKVEMGITVRNGQGSCVFNAEDDLVAALKNPGKTEVKYIPLGNGLSLQIEAKVVGGPAFQPTRIPEGAGPNEAWNRFWFGEDPAQATVAKPGVRTNR